MNLVRRLTELSRAQAIGLRWYSRWLIVLVCASGVVSLSLASDDAAAPTTDISAEELSDAPLPDDLDLGDESAELVSDGAFEITADELATAIDDESAPEPSADTERGAEKAVVEAVPDASPAEPVEPAASDANEDPAAEAAPLEAPACDSPHQVWLISSRAIRSCGDLSIAAQKLRFWRHEHGRGWVDSNREEFLASDDPAMPTAFYVHGHRVDPEYAREGGWNAYRAFVKNSAAPTRFVIWSWPTTPQGRPLEDFRIKADASELHSYYLAWLVDRIDPAVPVHLVGYSYGARLITGSLHLLGGGVLMGNALDERVSGSRAVLNASLLAAALDNDWLIPGRRHGQALTQVNRMFITRNCLDPVLHFYPVVLRNRGATALGVTGFAGLNRIGDERQKIEQINVSGAIGKHHAIERYWESGRVTAELRQLSEESLPAELALAE